MYVKPKPLNTYPWFIRLFFWKQKKTYGEVLDPGLLWGRSPKVFATLALLFGAINRRRSPIPGPLRSMITVRVSQINHCPFCIDINSAVMLKRGVPQEKLEVLDVWQYSDLFDEVERVALEFAEAVTHSGERVSPELMARLKEHFDDDAVIELTGLIAFQNMSSKFNSALDVPAQGFCKVPLPSDDPHQDDE